MKILQIANGDFFSTFGGGQVYVKNLVDEMIHQELDVVVFSFLNYPSPDLYKEKIYKGIPLFEIFSKDEIFLQQFIQKLNPDIIHAHAEKALLATIAHRLNIPLVITAHHGGIICPAGSLLDTDDRICSRAVNHKDCLACVLRNTKGGMKVYPFISKIPLSTRISMGQWIKKLPFIYFVTPFLQASETIERKLEEWKTITKKADYLIAPSYRIAENMKMNHLSSDKITVIPHGIPVFQKQEKRTIKKKQKIKFFYIGRISYVKGIHNLLEAFSQLDQELCELHLIGDLSGAYQEKLINQYKSFHSIVFHGKIPPDQVFDFIDRFDVLVHPAIYLEVFGLNISEALSMGKPVIATRCGGAELQIKDKVNGLLIEPNNVSELKEAMCWILKNKSEVEKMKKIAREAVIPINSHVKEIIKVYESLMTKRNDK